MSVTIYDVAKHANVSMATVSRVVNGNPNVKPATRDKVNRAIEELNYRPNAVARGLASKKSTTIGVVIPDISNIYYGQLTSGMEDIANMYNYQTLFATSDFNKDKEIAIMESFISKQVDGIIFLGGMIFDETKALIKSSNIPVVVAGTLPDNDDIPTVNIDYFDASYHVVKELIHRGHRSFSLIMGDREVKSNQLMIEGIQKALKDNALNDINLIIDQSFGYDVAYTKVHQVNIEETDIVLTQTDEQAVATLQYFTDHDIKVPDDIQILSFIDSKLLHMVRPDISAVEQPLYDIGAVGMRLLTKFMLNETVDEKHVKLPYTIQYRKTTK